MHSRRSPHLSDFRLHAAMSAYVPAFLPCLSNLSPRSSFGLANDLWSLFILSVLC
ncbi:hypothetical protein PAXRUDRAFT_826502 [Paxillus rubicundulus Ve08.2h10]|uniref:Uncharacterized protein n=1 Tax=Paxillus rubicundulus Ve08.2h10 TaxID=930991 RepID=A0A0D0E4A5_9AGAM|nr:hypothetical protein PAXRUDRAFT_826502 [Paxillus rubicundulus Ve08.2h10]